MGDRARRSRAVVSRRRRRTLGTLAWTVGLLLAGETGVRVRAWYRHGTHTPVAAIFEPHHSLGRRLRPGATLQGAQRTLSVNRWGFRGADIPKSKPPHTVRIAAIGGSATLGMEASSDEAVWVARMTLALNQPQNDTRYDAINGGVPGYTLALSAIQLTEDIAPFDPDIVIVYHVANDIAAHARRQFSAIRITAGPSSPVTRLVQKNSLLFNLIRLNTASFTSKRLSQRRHDRLEDRGVQAYAARLRRIVEICEDNGWRAILATCPRAFGDESAPTDQYAMAASALANNPALSLAGLNDAYTRYNDAVRSVAAQTGVSLVDLDRLVPKRRTYFVDAHHLNDTGHELVGTAFARAILAPPNEGAIARRKP